jgi:cystathionine beta-lyase
MLETVAARMERLYIWKVSPETTYLLWLDCNTLLKTGKIKGTPAEHYLEKGRLALIDGSEFGPGGKGFVRLNFACPRLVLEETLVRMKKATA